VRDELLVGGVEPESRRQLHGLLPLLLLLVAVVMVHVVLHLLPGQRAKDRRLNPLLDHSLMRLHKHTS